MTNKVTKEQLEVMFNNEQAKRVGIVAAFEAVKKELLASDANLNEIKANHEKLVEEEKESKETKKKDGK